MKLYKFTEQDATTYEKSTLWGEGVTHKKEKKDNPNLCSSDVIHAYKNLNLGLLLNPIHADIQKPRIWEAKGVVVAKDFGKVGCFSLTTVKEIDTPEWVKSDKVLFVRIQFAILCAEAVLHHFEDKYPTDKRPREAIEDAKAYLKDPTARAAAAADAYAADAYAAAAYAAADAADAAARAADAAARAALDFGKLADLAVKMIMK